MKGMMTTNVLVWLAIAIIVLLALVSMLMGIVPPSSQSLKCQASFNLGCNKFVAAGGCKDESINIFQGCGGGADTCSSPPSEEDDKGCVYVKCTVAECAVGTVDPNAVRASCCKESSGESSE